MDRRAAEHVLSEMISREPRRLPTRIGRIIRDEFTAEDLAQDALLRALRSLAGLRGEPEEPLLCAWLDRIARNVAYNHLRDARPAPATLSEPETGVTPTAPPTDDPAIAFQATATREQLRDLIRLLPPGLRQVFLLRESEGLSTRETAEALGIKPNLVKLRLHRARQLLRGWLREADGAGDETVDS